MAFSTCLLRDSLGDVFCSPSAGRVSGNSVAPILSGSPVLLPRCTLPLLLRLNHFTEQGKYLGAIYFSVGLIGSLAICFEPTGETPVLIAVFVLWALSSFLGLFLILCTGNLEDVSPLFTALTLLLLLFSGAVSFLTAQWIVEDYYAHLHMSEGITKNMGIIVAHPENVSINGTG